MKAKGQKLGEILAQRGLLDEFRLRTALGEQKRWGGSFGNTLIRLGYCTPDAVLQALSDQQEVPAVNLDEAAPDPEALLTIGKKCALKNRVVPLRLEGPRREILVVAMPAPLKLSALDEVRTASGKQKVISVVALDEAVDRALEAYYGKAEGAAPAEPLTREFSSAPKTDPRQRPAITHVYFFGCDRETLKKGMSILVKASIPSSEATELDLQASQPHDVVIAPLERVEALVKQGEGITARVVVVSATPNEDIHRAVAAGAAGVVGIPLDEKRLMEVVTAQAKPA